MQSKGLFGDQLTFSRLFVSIYLLLVSELALRKRHSLSWYYANIACRGKKKSVYSLDHINYSKSECRAGQSTLTLCTMVTYGCNIVAITFLYYILYDTFIIFMLCSVKSLYLSLSMYSSGDADKAPCKNTLNGTTTPLNLQCETYSVTSGSQIPKQMVLLSRLFLVNNFVCLCFMKNTKEILLNSKSITELMCHTYLTTSYYFCEELLYYLGFVGFKSVFLMTDCAFHNHSKD